MFLQATSFFVLLKKRQGGPGVYYKANERLLYRNEGQIDERKRGDEKTKKRGEKIRNLSKLQRDQGYIPHTLKKENSLARAGGNDAAPTSFTRCCKRTRSLEKTQSIHLVSYALDVIDHNSVQ